MACCPVVAIVVYTRVPAQSWVQGRDWAHLPKSYYDSVTRELLVLQSKATVAVRDVGIDLLEATVIEREPYPLPEGPFPFSVLALNGLGSSAPSECIVVAEQLLVQWYEATDLNLGPKIQP